MKIKLSILKNDYALSLFNKIYSILMGIISSAFYIRYLGLEYKGTYSYINEIATIIGLIVNFGIYQSYPFYYRKYGHKVYEKYISTFLSQFLIYTIAATVVASVFNANMVVVLACAQLPCLVLKTQMDNVIMVENIRIYMWIDMGIKTVLTIIYFLLWMFAEVHISYVVFAVALTNFVVSIIYLYVTHYRPSIKSLKLDVTFMGEVMRFGFYPMLSALLMTLNYSVDILFLKNMGTAEELSLYSVAAVIINYVWVIPNAFKEVLISKVARTEADDQVAFSCRLSILITLVCMIGFCILGKYAIGLVFGKEFAKCYLVTIVLFAGAFSMIFFKMLGVVFVAEGKQKTYFIILLISVIANLIANYTLIPLWGMYGAAIASVTSYTICGVAFLITYCKWKKTTLIKYVFISKTDVQSILGLVRKKGKQ